MPSATTRLQKPTFTKPQYFTQAGRNRWFCNICTPDSLSPEYMNARAAMQHERDSAAHAHNVSEIEVWWSPSAPDPEAWNDPLQEGAPLTAEQMKDRESLLHVDSVQEMVPFWIRGVEAAERGEVLRLEEFLETLEQQSWAWINQVPPWTFAYSAGEWPDTGHTEPQATNGWERRDDKSISSRRECQVRLDSHRGESRKKRSKGKVKTRRPRDVDQGGSGHLGDAHAFVEDIARQEAADGERKRKMHMFFEMPTQDKIKKIDEVVRALRSVPV